MFFLSCAIALKREMLWKVESGSLLLFYYFFIRYTNFPSNGFEMGYYLLNNDCANEVSIRDLLYFLRATCQLVRIFTFASDTTFRPCTNGAVARKWARLPSSVFNLNSSVVRYLWSQSGPVTSSLNKEYSMTTWGDVLHSFEKTSGFLQPGV